MRIDKLFILNWEKIWIIVVGAFLSIILHNLLSALFEVEEAFFFILIVFLIPAYTLIALPVTLISVVKKRKQNSK
ncbi:hypothetical protein ACFL0C_01360 [Patescibacteria group bacterium]